MPQERAFVIERFGRYLKTIQAGIHLLIPFVDRIAYVHSLEGRRIPIRDQPASTKDGADILIDSTLFVKVFNLNLWFLVSVCIWFEWDSELLAVFHSL